MVILNVEKLLEEKGKKKYWLYNELNNMKIISYTNFDNMIKQKTRSITYENMERLCKVLECTPNELFTIVNGD